MNKKLLLTFMACALSSCTYFQKGAGQVVYHWEKPHTGVEKFSRDHAECLMAAKEFKLMPDFRSWFYTEETKLDTRADWKSSKGIWASYVPYPGAQPLVVITGVYDERTTSRKLPTSTFTKLVRPTCGSRSAHPISEAAFGDNNRRPPLCKK